MLLVYTSTTKSNICVRSKKVKYDIICYIFTNATKLCGVNN